MRDNRQQRQLMMWILVDLIGTGIAIAGFYKLVSQDEAFLAGASPMLLLAVGGALILLAFIQILRTRLKLKKPVNLDD